MNQHETETNEEKRERLRRQLRSKTRRNGQGQLTRNQILHDPQTALLALGVDNKEVLDNAKSIVHAAKHMHTQKENTKKMPPKRSINFEDSDEELPEIPDTWLVNKVRSE